ncbi:hypothetical protein ACP3TC_10305 [Winslowiella sp. 2C04]|uniref:hypothetical protein n=1 Tax=Winslowiella sp. 2C04 TaxID=3416179 RepID=UPI003CF0B689
MNNRSLLSLLMVITFFVIFSPGKTLAFKSGDIRHSQPFVSYHTAVTRDDINYLDINVDFGIV